MKIKLHHVYLIITLIELSLLLLFLLLSFCIWHTHVYSYYTMQPRSWLSAIEVYLTIFIGLILLLVVTSGRLIRTKLKKLSNQAQAQENQLAICAQQLQADNTDRKQSEFYLSSVSHIQKLYISGVSQSELFDAILKFLLDYTQSEYGFIGAILHDQNHTPYLKTYAITNIAWSKETREFYEQNAPQGLEFTNLNTLFGYTIKTGEAVISNDPLNDHRSGGLPQGHPDMNCYLGMPIRGNKGTIAMYGLANKKGGYQEEIINELQTITTVMASIIEASRSLSIVEQLANHDPLTNAYNRLYFKTQLQAILANKYQHNTPKHFCIMMLDLDKFKHINDYYGHEYGDYVLKEFVKRIRKTIVDQQLLTRLGGDEFVILLENINQPDSAVTIAQAIIHIASEPYVFNNKELICDVSIGITCCPKSTDNIDLLLRQADLALYRAKRSQEGYAFFSEELQTEYLARQNLEREILQAFDQEELYLVFQPIISLTTGEVTGCEGLVRWRHPTKGMILPSHYVEIIESMGLAEQLNTYVTQACLQLFHQSLSLTKPFIVSINISPHTHNIEQHLEQIINILASKQDQHHPLLQFNLEITETSFMESEVELRKNSRLADILAKYNISFVLDDFGVEYSSITRLLESNFSAIKIDMSFVQQLDSKDQTAAHAAKVTIEAIMHLARGLNIRVIAEGIETSQQAEILANLGCQYAQGNYFYEPLTFAQLKPLLT